MAHSATVRSDEETIAWLSPLTVDPVVVAIDAHLIVRNLCLDLTAASGARVPCCQSSSTRDAG